MLGRATLEDPHTVAVTAADGTVSRRAARHILVATGGTPQRPSFPGAELAMVSDDVFYLPRRPDRMLVIGGGYIGLEIGSVYAAMGTKVTVVEFTDGLLPLADRYIPIITDEYPDPTFGSGRYATSRDRGTSFKTTTVYRTYDRDWRTTGTELRLTDGRRVAIAGAVVRF